VWVGGPDKRSGFAVALAELVVDRRLEWMQRVAGGSGERGEEGLDGIRPRAGGECEKNMQRRRWARQLRGLGWIVGGIFVERCIDQG
jgi:hypothetical protein